MIPDLSTRYLGLKLNSPLVAAASPLTGNVDSLVELEEMGVAAVVLPSLFEEQIQHLEMQLAMMHDSQSEVSAESSCFFPELDTYNTGPERYLEIIQTARAATSIPVIASLNGCSPGGWLHYGRLIEQAGADALELNIYSIPTDAALRGHDLEASYGEVVAGLKHHLSIPLAVKIGPYFSSIPAIAKQLIEAGADGLVLFNRYLAPDIDLETLEFKPALELSQPHELRLALRWIAILHDQVEVSLAATGGVHQVDDVVKALMAGADVTMIASALLQRGRGVICSLKSELSTWMANHDYPSVEQIKGCMSYQNCINPDGLLRANYMRALTSYTTQVHRY
jgi:dihydroorotate dehydrogenase (fumarate)